MIANWKNPKKELPPERIRVLVCSDIGFIQTAFYGCQSSIAGDRTVCWRSDEMNNGLEKALPLHDVAAWDRLPEHPWVKRDIWTHEPLPKAGHDIAEVAETIGFYDFSSSSNYVLKNWGLIRKLLNNFAESMRFSRHAHFSEVECIPQPDDYDDAEQLEKYRKALEAIFNHEET